LSCVKGYGAVLEVARMKRIWTRAREKRNFTSHFEWLVSISIENIKIENTVETKTPLGCLRHQKIISKRTIPLKWRTR